MEPNKITMAKQENGGKFRNWTGMTDTTNGYLNR